MKGTPAYASPENFNNLPAVSFPTDIWSLAASMFHLVSGRLPFDCSSPIAASINIAGDMNSKAPDVRDAVPENLRSGISSAFAEVIAKGLEKRLENRFASVDEMAAALHDCLVQVIFLHSFMSLLSLTLGLQRGEEIYTVFISYRVFSEKYHAAMLFELLNNTTTPAGHRVIVYLDAKRLVKGEDWEDGFSTGLLGSLVALPLISQGVLEPMTKLRGDDSDRPDNVAKEFMIMQAIQGRPEQTLQTIYPIFIGCPYEKNDVNYPHTGNFFHQSSHLIDALVDVPSPPTTNAVASFLKRRAKLEQADAASTLTVRGGVKGLLAIQGAQLWSHTDGLPEEEMHEDSELFQRVQRDPPNPPLDFEQLKALKAQLRALVPGIYEVIDRAYVDAARCKASVGAQRLPSS